MALTITSYLPPLCHRRCPPTITTTIHTTLTVKKITKSTLLARVIIWLFTVCFCCNPDSTLISTKDLDSPSSVEPSLAHVHSHSMNMQSVLLHVAGDALASIAVIVSALVIKFATLWENRYLMDPILSLTITVIIVYSTIPLVRKSSLVLLQSVPARIPIDRIRQDILNVFISFWLFLFWSVFCFFNDLFALCWMIMNQSTLWIDWLFTF